MKRGLGRKEQKLIKVCSFRSIKNEFSLSIMFWEFSVSGSGKTFSIAICKFCKFFQFSIYEENLFRAHSSTSWVVFLVKIFSCAPLAQIDVLLLFVFHSKSNLTLKRRNDLLMLVLARYMSTHGVVARKCSRTEWTRYADALMALSDVGS